MSLSIPLPGHSLGITPYPDESLVGFLFRLARRRRLHTIRPLMSASGIVNLTAQPNGQQLHALAEVASLKVGQLEAITYGPPNPAIGLFRGIPLPSNAFDGRGEAQRRVCPDCLRDAPYHRAIWDLLFISVCLVHHKVLVDTCRQCGEALRWIGSDLTRCGHADKGDLTQAVADEVSEADVRATRAVHGLLKDERYAADAEKVRALPPFRDLADNYIVEFLYRFGLEVIGSRPKIFSTEQTGEIAWSAHLALNRGLEVAEHWPDGFFGALDNMRRRSASRVAASLRRYVWPTERWLDRLPVGTGHMIRAAVDDYKAAAKGATEAAAAAPPGPGHR